MDLPSDFEALPDVARTILAVVLDVSLKGAVLLALAGVIAASLRQASAAARHLVWCVAVCAVLLLPVLALTLPAWPVTVPFFEETVTTLHHVLPDAPGPSATVPSEAAPLLDAPPLGPSVPPPTTSTLAPPLAEILSARFLQVYAAARATPWTVWLLLVWLVGAGIVLVRFLVGAAGVMWLAFHARPVEDPAWRRLSRRVRQRLGLHRSVRLLRSPRAAMPMTWGLWRPVVLLPVGAGTWPEARRRCVLVHEMAHVRRLDCLTQALAHLACALYWFNPLVWVAARAMRQEREQACDDAVLVGGMLPSAYARHLLDIARTSRSTLVTPLSAVAMARPSQLEGRIVAILDARRRRHAPPRAATVATVLVVGLLALPLAAMRPAGSSTTTAEGGIEAVETSQGAGHRWAATLPWGAVLEVRSTRGIVQALPAQGRLAEIIAVPRHTKKADTPFFAIARHDDRVTVCAVESEPCSGTAGARAEAKEQEVDFYVWVPEGVRLAAQTEHGAIRAKALRSDLRVRSTHGAIAVETTGFVKAESVHGNIEIVTATFGQAHSVHGDVRAHLGTTRWRGTLPFHSDHGDIVVALPAVADTEIALEVGAQGQLRSSLPLVRQPGSATRRFQTTLGTGGRLLALHATYGNATILYDGGAPHASESVAVAPAPRETAPVTTPWLQRFAARPEAQRLAAVRSLGSRNQEGSLMHLGLVLGEDPSHAVRALAAEEIGDIGCPDGVPALMIALDDESPKVRRAAVEALGAIADERAREALAHAAEHDTDAAVRRHAARTLGLLNHAAARVVAPAPPALAPAFAETTEAQRRAVLMTAEALGVAVEAKRLATTLDHEREWVRYVRRLAGLGYEEAPDDVLVLAHAVGVTPGYVRSIQRTGLDVSLTGIIRLKAGGVTPVFVKKRVAEAGTWISVEQLVEEHLVPAVLPHIDAEALRGPAAPENQPQ